MTSTNPTTIEALIEEQKENEANLLQAISNYKKSPKERKNLEYVEKWQRNLTDLWHTFQRVDHRLRIDLPEKHEYLKRDAYASVGSKYFDIHTSIENELTILKAALKLEETSATQGQVASTSKKDEAIVTTVPAPMIKPTEVISRMSTTDPASVVKSAESAKLTKQRQIIAVVQKMIQQVLSNIEDKPYQYYELNLKSINQHWAHAQMLHEQLFTMTEDSPAYNFNAYLAAEEEINKGLIIIQEKMQHILTDHNQTQGNNRVPTSIKLPQIELPKFDGNYLQWRQFHDLFLELVHNSTIPACQKMIYLKSSLTGEAKSLISHFTTSAVNYESAWKVLVERYDNKRILVNTLLAKLISQPNAQADTATSLKLLHDVTQECLMSLQGLNISTENWDPLILYILVQRLSKNNHALWEQSLTHPREIPKISEFLAFLKLRFQSLEAHQSEGTFATSTSKKIVGASAISNNKCSVCEESHAIYSCAKFLKLTPKERLNVVQRAGLCVNCLKHGHKAKTCSSSSCTKCNKRHNSLLHLGSIESPTTTIQGPLPSITTTVGSSVYHPVPVLLSTARVYLTDAKGEKHECRALLDSGSQANFISKSLAHQLGLPMSMRMIDIEGIGQTQSKSKGRVNLQLSSMHTGFEKRIEALVMPKIVSTQPARNIDKSAWKIPSNIKLSDTTFDKPGRIDLLIGAGLFYSILSVGQIALGTGCPILQNTLLGWVIGGECNAEAGANLYCGVGVADELNDELEKFWKLEEVEANSNSFTANEARCEAHFLQNIRRAADGRYIVKLPFDVDPKELGRSSDIALQRFKAIERKLEANPALRDEYINFMREYERLNHMHEISPPSIQDAHYFLPHHAVFKADSTTTKVRVVFDASAKSSTNYSLNDLLATGPTIQADVFTTILRFRFPRYAFTADIEKMYRQIWVNEADRPYQLIWWREKSTLPLRCMQLATVTYGTTCAPYLATRVLQYIADTHLEYPLASRALKTNFYVDDALTGANTMSEALELQTQLLQVLRSAGLHLRKWCANDPRLLQKIPENDKEVSLHLAESKEEKIKMMGLIWYPKDDIFTVKVSQVCTNKITKRSSLADISRLFDPLGLVAPVVVTAKVFLQNLWKLKLDWDAALPQELQSKWQSFRRELSNLEKINIPRHIYNHKEPKNIQLHVFADASEAAYGTAVYVRVVDKEDVIIVRLLCSKSRVAPTKQVSLPRLELCAAKLATDLTTRLKSDNILLNCETYYWTDSTVVLGWIHATSSNYHTFVANRISAIQQVSSPQQWHHVPGKDNPADLISRGIMPEQLINNVLWFYGPLFLHSPITSWPLQPPLDKCTLEIRQNVSIISTAAYSNSPSIFDTVNHKNSLHKFQRIIAYAQRFINKCQTARNNSSTHNLKSSCEHAQFVATPSACEMQDALQLLVKISQQQDFAEELKSLQQKKCVETTNRISSLAPFIDDKGIIRVGGRLEASNLAYDAKHQMLLSYHHPFTKLIFENLHKEHLHVGIQGLLAIVRQRFWPLKGKNIARSTIQGCIFCTRAKPKLCEQLMGPLPRDRVQPTRPFLNAGVDFFGPIWVHLKLRGRRPLKSYVAVFCCFSTKAVHLELVSDLSTDAFLGALKRFMARRGHCSKLYCDNATNFVGARNQLIDLKDIIFHESTRRQIKTECSKKNIDFAFIPPRAPHFGGLWEAAVKSAKHLLQSTISSANLTHEEMETLLTEAEAILNSRPLTPMSSDPNDLTALTPGHFLIGAPLTSTADPHARGCTLKPTVHWKAVSQLKMEFWKRWSHEYLHTLQQRYKWKKETTNIKPNTMVLIKEDNLPSLKWSLGRVVNVIRGEDGLVRVVDIKTPTNVIRRPITKVAPLPIEDEFIDEDAHIINDEDSHAINDNDSHLAKRPKFNEG